MCRFFPSPFPASSTPPFFCACLHKFAQVYWHFAKDGSVTSILFLSLPRGSFHQECRDDDRLIQQVTRTMSNVGNPSPSAKPRPSRVVLSIPCLDVSNVILQCF